MLTTVVLWLRLDTYRYKNTVDDNDLKDKIKTLTILYLAHHPMIMQIKLMRCMQLTSIVSFQGFPDKAL